MNIGDSKLWAGMRAQLGPEETLHAHRAFIGEILSASRALGFIAESREGTPAGFAAIAIRDYANGCESRPVAFLEGIWVSPEYRRRGVGAKLLDHAEKFLITRGYSEIGSDAPLDNLMSHAAHARWGFTETERVVYFRKALRFPSSWLHYQPE